MKIAKFLWLLLWVLGSVSLPAQNYVVSNDIPITVGNQLLKAAWAGGLNAPQMSSVDLDNDGILDLVVYDRDGGTLLPFLNAGTALQIDYRYAPQYNVQFPSLLSDWTLFRDFDADGYMDIFTAVPQVSNVRVYRNTSQFTGGTLSFSLYQDTIITNYPPVLPLYVGKSDIPAIDDLDGDGDLDILTFQLGGTKVEWHKNLSIENTGGLGGLEFIVQSHCFGHFEEDPFGCSALIGRVPCGPGQRNAPDPADPLGIALHSGSTLLSLDLDSNGRKDLVIGDIGCSSLYALYNGGTLQIADFVGNETAFPSYDTAAAVIIFPASYYLDVDNDGIKDLLVAPNTANQVEDQKSIQYYRNTGTNGMPHFSFQRYGILQDEMIDLGTSAKPTFMDYNGDGLQDLLIGAAGRFDSLVGFHPLLALYKNVGTAQQPAFDLVSADYLNLRSHPAFTNASYLHPTAGDLDGDGDQDLLLGNVDGAIFHFANTAGPGNPASYLLQTANFAGIDVGFQSAPQLVDLDGDNDFDLLVGNQRGFIYYYQNQGSVSIPNFVLVSDTFGHVKINDFTGFNTSNGVAQPFVCDYDLDQDLDLLVGTIEGEVQVYENITLSPSAVFARAADLFGRDFGGNVSPAAVVLDSARLSFVVGSHRGGLTLMRPGGPVAIAAPTGQPSLEIKLFPNPAGSQLAFELKAAHGAVNSWVIHDLLGRQQASSLIEGAVGSIDVSALRSGIYVITFAGKLGQWSQRFVVAH